MDLSLIDRIYECAFAPEFWPDVMDEFAKISDARGGMLIAANSETEIPTWTASKDLSHMMGEYIRGDLFRRGRATKSLMASRHTGFMRNNDVLTNEEMQADPVYRDLLWPIGLGSSVGTAIPAPTGDTLVCIVHRELAKGPVDPAVVQQLDVLRPHLARSGLISARLHLERARAVADALEMLGLPALVFAFDGRVLAANALIEGETAHIRWRAGDHFALSNKTANAMFQLALESLAVDDPPSTRSFALRDPASVAAKVAHVVPIRGASREIFARSAGVLMLTPVTVPEGPPVELIQSLFDLTPAEAGVARHVTSGQTLRRIAAVGHVSTNTVRTQLRSILKKTGCRRQAEVVALLSGLAIPGKQGSASRSAGDIPTDS